MKQLLTIFITTVLLTLTFTAYTQTASADWYLLYPPISVNTEAAPAGKPQVKLRILEIIDNFRKKADTPG